VALPPNCPLCQAGGDRQDVVTRHVYGSEDAERAFFHCSSCDVRYLYPRLTAEQESHFYASEFEGFMAGRAGAAGGWTKVDDHIRANESTRLRRMRYLQPHLQPGARILEIGCSSGFMLQPLVRAGHACVGIEPSGVFGDYLRSRDLEIYQTLEQLSEARSDARFDLIMHFFVLEHIAEPREFLQAQLALLKSGGTLVFEIPNAADPLYSVYDIAAFERFYWSIAHAWYFSEDSLHHLLKQIGRRYQVLREQRYDLSNHMVWARDGRPGGSGRFTKSLGQELEDSYKRELIRVGRCDTLVGIITGST
jgi:2-polyprenyl-3-methyl-5-hydroxy-6-metoxy-1,4-benzoquinol methylase